MGQGVFVALSGSTVLHDSLIYFKQSSACAATNARRMALQGMCMGDMGT